MLINFSSLPRQASWCVLRSQEHSNGETCVKFEMEAKAEDPEPLLEAKTQSDWAIDGSSVWSTDGSSCLQAGELDLERCVLSQ